MFKIAINQNWYSHIAVSAVLILAICLAVWDTFEVVATLFHFIFSHLLTGERLSDVEAYQLPSFILTHLPFLPLNTVLFIALWKKYRKQNYRAVLYLGFSLIISSLLYNGYIFYTTNELPLWIDALANTGEY